MIDAPASQQLRDAIMTQAGGYLANPVRQDRVTCEVCATPIDDRFTVCGPCYNARQSGQPLADLVGSTTYARAPHQSGYLMHGYKASPPQHQLQLVVQLLLADALMSHLECAENLVDETITQWTTVPSLTKKRTWHPLRDLVNPIMKGTPEVSVTAAEKWTSHRQVTPDNFAVHGDVSDEHVLVVDDTWTSGAQSQSVAVDLKAAGASHVTVYTVARWLDPDWPPTKAFLTERGRMDPKPRFDPRICPFTHGACP